MAFQAISFHGYRIKGEDLFIVAPIEETQEKDNGKTTVRQMVLPLYAKYHAHPYRLVLLSQPILESPTNEQQEEWAAGWQARHNAYDQLIADWEKR